MSHASPARRSFAAPAISSSTPTAARRIGPNVERSAALRIDRRATPRSPSSRTNQALAQEFVRLKIHSDQPIVPAEGNRSAAYRLSKRALDIVGATAALVIFSPLLLSVAVVLTVTTKGKPLFIQQRIGLRGRKFPLLKFRTMRLDADRVQDKIENEKDGPIFKNRTDPRITPIGRILRKTSIDEAPQLINVLLGHMSLVGPRPPVEKEVVQYEPWQRRRLAVKPGLTCLWQVSGRSDIGFVDWVRMDLWYVQNQGLWTDLVLLARTPWTVVTCRGAY